MSKNQDQESQQSQETQGTQELTTSNVVPPDNAVDLLSIFECCVCYDHATTQIYQCKSGRHHVCFNCQPHIKSCPLCRTPMGKSRNHYLEKVAACLKFPCVHSMNGCKTLITNTDRIQHEKNCDYRWLSCPSPVVDCKWKGMSNSIVNHFQLFHKDVINLEGEDIIFLVMDIDSIESNNWIMFQSCHQETFMLSLSKEYSENNAYQFFAAVQLLGTRKKSLKFAYRFELNGNGKQVAWKSVTKSICEDISNITAENDCFVFDSKTAKLFIVNGNLGMNVTIAKL